MLAVSLLLLLALTAASQAVRYEPTWESLDSRPLPTWYDEAKFGIFIHWGVFSVPSFGSEWFWNYWHGGSKKYVDFMKKNYPPSWTYADFAPQFTAEFYDPKTWAEIFKASGAKYIVLTSKHHEGFCNWPTNVSFNWNAMEVGPKRDLVGDLATAIRNYTDIHFGLYHSLFEWFNPLYLEDATNKFKTQKFVKGKTIPELYEIVNRYKPDVIWSDGCKGPDDYWTSKEFLAWLYNDSPVKDRVVTNDRWGDGCLCKHGGYYTCNDRFNPGHLLPHKWENCMTIDQHSWGYRREARLSDFLTTPKLISELASTVSCGGNLLMNVGPTHDGRIAPIFEERLRDMGAWLDVNGEAIYSSKPWTNQNDTLTKNVWYTSKKQSDGFVAAYAMLLDVPSPPSVVLGAPKVSKDTVITLLGYKTPLKWVAGPKGGVEVQVPALGESQMPTKWAWVLKMEGLMN